MTDLIIVGAGGFGLEVEAYAKDMVEAGKASFEIKGYLDDTKKPGTQHGSSKVLGSTKEPIDQNAVYVIAIGAPEDREELAQNLMKLGAKFTSIIHPLSYVAASAKIGLGCVLAPFSFVGPESTIGTHSVLNVHASVGHECELESFCVLSPYAGTHGNSILKAGAFLGSNAYITAGVEVGAAARIAAGAVVYNDIPNGLLALGNPARTQAA